jgi:hypothetical protein
VFLQAGKRFSFYMISNIYISSHMNLAGRIDRNFVVIPLPICELSIGRKLWWFFSAILVEPKSYADQWWPLW